jgi:replication factor C subunit 2/4
MEGVVMGEGAMDQVMKASDGDMRRAVTFMQTAHELSAGAGVVKEDIVDISGEVDALVIVL